ncbi:rhodanese-like domain-containing protein [Puerhibacterium sp. TATVAM-FAB25]|uniref:rhodanese-like domain-containing protein n=1 Tax=Puerhibacterium sp. TATVAM-FAB25 TaxID=3093699 RepID=UPI00397C8410
MFPPMQPEVPTVDVHDLDPAAPVPDGTTLLDVREQDEWDAGHAPGAVHIPLGELPVRYGELDPDAPVYVVCRSGGRSARAAQFLADGVGYDATNLDGGMLAWEQRGLPVDR